MLGFIRSLAYVVIFGVLSFLANAANLADVMSPQLVTIVTVVATAFLGMLDGHIETKTGKAVFGAVKK